MLRQYHELKRQHPGTLLFFRLGDFYELFFEDALTGSRELEITLTARHKERGEAIPMCGVPHHSASNHIAKLVRRGYRVAICEQTEEASQTKKLVRREVVRIITPGTALDPQMIEARETVYLASVCGTGERMAAAFLDLSTGEFRATEASGPEAWARIRADLESYAPREILFPASLTPLIKNARDGGSGGGATTHTAPLPLRKNVESETGRTLSDGSGFAANHSTDTDTAFAGATLTPLDDWQWQGDACARQLCAQFGSLSLEGFGLEDKPEAVRAAGACLLYAQETQRAAAAHVTDIHYFEPQDHLILDQVTVRNLELIESQGTGNRTYPLIKVIDETVSSMGGRLLRSWMLRPSVRRGEVEARLSAVEELHKSQMKRDRLRVLLKEVADLERLTGRLNMQTASPRDLNSLLRSLNQVPTIRQTLSDSTASLLQILFESMDEMQEIRSLIEQSIADEPPLKLSDGGAVREGYSDELDELRSISRDAKRIIASLESRERARSGIHTLRIRYNNVFGYFIEVSKANSARVPPDYERRQTLANAERYTTPELKALEAKVLGAEDRIAPLETEIFCRICSRIAAETKRIQATARALSTLDALAALAEVAARRRYVRPVMHEGDEIEIVQGRHPVIEAVNQEPFIPNDLYMNNSTDRLLIITGPNMGGKSTVLRQAALISILAQMGSFVPANSARLPLLDRIWTRVGASDDLSRGRSTFMVEMTETAAILHSATPRSLVLLDEIGRGTATFDGLSIAWAVAEYLHDSAEHAAKTLFATHYHELTELAERLPGAQNYQIMAAERDGEVVFLHRLEKGSASKSYGIEVARLAGLPPDVLSRARDVLSRLERYELDVFTDKESVGGGDSTQAEDWDSWALDEAGLKQAARRARQKRIATQATLFDAANQSILDAVRDVDVETLKPEEALDILQDIRKRLI
jgi:DNA mismatch repair protein MutS